MNWLKRFKPFVKYCLVGVSGTLIDVGTLYALVEYAGWPVLTATSASFLFSVINNFFWNKVWTFRNRSTNIRKLFIKFFLVALGGLALTNLCMWTLVSAGLWYIWAKLITSAVVLSWNFLVNKYWTFKIRSPRHPMPESLPFELSVVVPAFNESRRIEATLREIHRYLSEQRMESEILVSDDGSTDGTVDLVRSLSSKIPNLRVSTTGKHRGKGRAARKGILGTQGRWVLLTDADGSTPIEEVTRLLRVAALDDAAVVIGSRYLRDSRVRIRQSRFRILIGRVGNLLIRSFIIDGIKDTQCGFKLFRQDAARDIFSRSKIDGWGFDMEALAVAKLRDYKIREVPVSWYNAPGSRLRPLHDAMKTFAELLYVKLNLWCARYEEG
ncbi:MAG: GtrA family protein [Candidatus Omnitrophica bacterium]|nr:GtrA family protein [Candidatus Omnitrophota bacterium]